MSTHIYRAVHEGKWADNFMDFNDDENVQILLNGIPTDIDRRFMQDIIVRVAQQLTKEHGFGSIHISISIHAEHKRIDI